MKKYIKLGIIFIFAIFINIIDIKAATDFAYGASLENIESSNGSYVYSCGNLKINFTVLKVSSNNTSKEDTTSDGTETSGRILNESDSRSLKKETIKFNENGTYVTTYEAQAGTKQTNKAIVFNITEETENVDGYVMNACEIGRITLNDKNGFNKIDQENAYIKFRIQIENPEMRKGKAEIRFETQYSRGNEGQNSGSYGVTLDFDIADKVNAAIENGGDLEDTYEENSSNVGEHIEESNNNSSNNYIPQKTSINGIGIGQSQKIVCDNSLKSFIDDIWSYFVIFGPILLIVMISLDFFKALFSSDSDMLTKAGSNTVKRTISALILLLLPLIIETILGFFGLELCI